MCLTITWKGGWGSLIGQASATFASCVGIGSAHPNPVEWVPHGKERFSCQEKQRADAGQAKQQMSTAFMDGKKKLFTGHYTWAKQ